jgi:hypothetical protein
MSHDQRRVDASPNGLDFTVAVGTSGRVDLTFTDRAGEPWEFPGTPVFQVHSGLGWDVPVTVFAVDNVVTVEWEADAHDGLGGQLLSYSLSGDGGDLAVLAGAYDVLPEGTPGNPTNGEMDLHVGDVEVHVTALIGGGGSYVPNPVDGEEGAVPVVRSGEFVLEVPAVPTAEDVGADPAGSAAAVAGDLSAHEDLTTDAHGGIVADDDARLSDARTPVSHGNEAHDEAYLHVAGTPSLGDVVVEGEDGPQWQQLVLDFDPAGSAAAVAGDLSAHEDLTTDAHGGIVGDDDARLSDARTPVSHGNEAHDEPYLHVAGTPSLGDVVVEGEDGPEWGPPPAGSIPNPELAGWTETSQSPTGATISIDPLDGNVLFLTISENTTIELVDPHPTAVTSLAIFITMDGGPWAITWFPDEDVVWAGGERPNPQPLDEVEVRVAYNPASGRYYCNYTDPFVTVTP